MVTNTPDPRLSDHRVQSVRKPVWDQGETEWDDNTLRPGFVERLAPYDPTPEYSRLDAENGLGDEPTADDLSDIHGYHTLTKVICVTVCIGWWVFVIFAIGFMVGGRYA